MELPPRPGPPLNSLPFQTTEQTSSSTDEDTKNAPLISGSVMSLINSQEDLRDHHGLLCRDATPQADQHVDSISVNIGAPWLAFICGSQGTGKTHTLSCFLENCLVQSELLGSNQKPLSAITFNYDPHNTGIPCEAAYLGSHIPVTVLTSPSSFSQRSKVYAGVNKNIKVRPLLFQNNHFNVQRLLHFMAFKNPDGTAPLHMELVTRVLRDMTMNARWENGIDLDQFLWFINGVKNLTPAQIVPLNQRIGLLRSLLATTNHPETKFGLSLSTMAQDPFFPRPGELTIIDLTDPLLDFHSISTLFEMCLTLCIENKPHVGKVVALDQAHNFLSDADPENVLGATLLQVVREQRHKNVSFIVSTQEPMIYPQLLDFCSMTFVHRFSSPAWLAVLRKHIAGAQNEELMEIIAKLRVGEALVFAPTAMLQTIGGKPQMLGVNHVHVKIRKRLTNNGGQGVMAG